MRNGPGVEERGILMTASYDQMVGRVPLAKVTVCRLWQSRSIMRYCSLKDTCYIVRATG